MEDFIMADNNVIKILEYWKTIEFLTQGNAKTDREIQEQKKPSTKNTKHWHTILRVSALQENTLQEKSLYSLIKETTASFDMKLWGTLTVYIGLIKREECIKNIIKSLNLSEDIERPEEDNSYIYMASLQLSANGEYIEHSFKLSPILWVIKKIKDTVDNDEAANIDLAQLIVMSQYDESIDILERKNLIEAESEQIEDTTEAPDLQYTQFSENAISLNTLHKLYENIKQTYIEKFVEDTVDKYSNHAFSENYDISFQTFIDHDTQEKYEDDSETGLQDNYYANDLELALNAERETGLEKDSFMGEDLQKYIVSLLNNESYKNRRIDVVNTDDQSFYEFSDLFSIKNAPLGKWPSKFSPALMQQLAINISVKKENKLDTHLLSEDNGKIFSVNGPPGTGKTTLLKEIVVNNVIEKARLLAKYDNPNDAFEKHGWTQNINSSYISGWYSLKDDRINDYSILVASCNNAAVENISKELPKNDFDLNPSNGDSEIFKSLLNEVSEIFDAQKSGLDEWWNPKKKDEDGKNIYTTYKDLYFNRFADELLQSSGKSNITEEIQSFDDKYNSDPHYKTWGLVSAPLGKQSNTKKLCNAVIKPFIFNSFYNKEASSQRQEDEKKKNQNRYKEACKAFKDQLVAVEEECIRLNEIFDINKRVISLQKKYDQIKQLMESQKKTFEKASKELKINQSKCKEKIEELQNRVNKQEEIIKVKTEEINSLNVKIQKETEEINDANSLIASINNKRLGTDVAKRIRTRQWEKKIEETEDEYNDENPIIRKFTKTKYEETIRQLETNLERDRKTLREMYKQDCIYTKKIQDEVTVIEKKVQTSKTQLSQYEESRSAAERAKKRYEDQITEENKTLAQLNDDFEKVKKENQKIISEEALAKKELEKTQKKQRELIQINQELSDVDKQTIIDDQFVKQREETNTQILNPWTTKRYDCAREKLFVLAMRFIKEFVVNSKCCKENLMALAMYWKQLQDGAKRCVVFSGKDKQALPALFQTLFLLVPVISSTFASVGRMFKDIKQSGVIGLLIVDEAGQAQPHMAVGALYRSRQAIIVGDPKQIEPVVTDDLDLLKRAYKDPIYDNYKKKSISVQSFADTINRFGTYLDGEWVGCPLLVHRRCISPMYDISNAISYDGIMKQQTAQPKLEKEEKFIYEYSRWIHDAGKEEGSKKHFVKSQGQKVCELLEIAYQKNEKPNIYIISPFTTVVKGIKKYIGDYCDDNKNKTSINKEHILNENNKRIGTVHTFQGKEADEVIFLLGCDRTARGAIQWVNSNIVNVAVTRAKYRLYVIGDKVAWKQNQYLRETMERIYIPVIDDIKEVAESNTDISKLPEENKDKLASMIDYLPTSADCLKIPEGVKDDSYDEFEIDTDKVINTIGKKFIDMKLSKELLGYFGFENEKELDALPEQLRNNISLGMRLYYLFTSVQSFVKGVNIDMSCWSIMFCKAMELQMRECFKDSLISLYPNMRTNTKTKKGQYLTIKDVEEKQMTLGFFTTILNSKVKDLQNHLQSENKEIYNTDWWRSFNERLNNCKNRRNECCHPTEFTMDKANELIYNMFQKPKEEENRKGVLFESEVGKMLKSDAS